MKEWITGRNPVYEVLRANRRQVFRLLLASGVEESPRLNETMRLAAQRKLQVERVPRLQLDSLQGSSSESHQGIALQVSGFPYSDLHSIRARAAAQQEDLFVLVLDALQNPLTTKSFVGHGSLRLWAMGYESREPVQKPGFISRIKFISVFIAF